MQSGYDIKVLLHHKGQLLRKLWTPNFILDNESSVDFRKALQKKGIKFQLVPPAAHRRNAAERAIRTFKNI